MGDYYLGRYLEEAKSMLINESEEFLFHYSQYNQQRVLIIALCLKYGLKYKFVNDVVFINSIIDEWYFQYTTNNFLLYHRNKLNTINQFHVQKKFKNIAHIIQYISKHDNFNYKPRKNKK